VQSTDQIVQQFLVVYQVALGYAPLAFVATGITSTLAFEFIDRSIVKHVTFYIRPTFVSISLGLPEGEHVACIANLTRKTLRSLLSGSASVSTIMVAFPCRSLALSLSLSLSLSLPLCNGNHYLIHDA
jgi:hypothetical protein